MILMQVEYSSFQSPLGRIHLLAGNDGLAAAFFDAQIADMERRFPPENRRPANGNPWLPRAEAFLARYFAGDFALPRIALTLGGTPFQQRVRRLLEAIPPGETRAYGELAGLLGNPSGGRAVGAAVGRNPLSIFVPCHRVVGAAGKLTGYAGGLDRKRFLLEHERTAAPASGQTADTAGLG